MFSKIQKKALGIASSVVLSTAHADLIDVHQLQLGIGQTVFGEITQTVLHISHRSSQVSAYFDPSWITSLHLFSGETQPVAAISVGPLWSLYMSNTSHITFSISPTYVNRNLMANRPIGGHWHFTSALAWEYQPRRNSWSFGLSIQHTSNAGLDRPNPGIDTISLVLRRQRNDY